MTNVSTHQFVSMDPDYLQFNQSTVSTNNALELFPSLDGVNRVLKDSHLPVIEPRRTSEYSVRALPDAACRDNACADTRPVSFGNDVSPAALMSMLAGLFTQFFNQLHIPLRADRLSPDSINSSVSAPQPRVTPVPDTKTVDRQGEPISELLTQRNGVKPNNIWNGFRQGRERNCVTVSAIKAAMAKFGQRPADIYKSVERVSGGHKVVMRDGFELTLTRAELTKAIRGSNLIGMTDPDMLKDAHFLYACSAKRAQMENNDGWASRSFNAAIRSLNDGEDEDRRNPGEGLKRLGLKDYMKRVSVRDFADKSLIGIVNRRDHSVAVVDGAEEIYGRKGRRPTDGTAIALV